MSQGNTSDEEIDLGQLFEIIKSTFRNFLRLIISVIVFYKKKWKLFAIITIAGILLGYFLDIYNIKENYTQEIIIQPNYDSTQYIYDYVEDFNNSFRDDEFIKGIKIKQDNISNLKGVTIEPIYEYADILDYYKNVYGEKDAYRVMGEITPEELKEEKYRKFYKFHKILFQYKTKNENQEALSQFILQSIKSNLYFKNIRNFEIEKVKKNIEENEKTLSFVNKYLKNINDQSENEKKSDKNLIIYSKEVKTPTISSLLDQKNTLINRIDKGKETLALSKEIFNIVEYKQILRRAKGVLGIKMILIPFIMVSIISLIFLFKFIWNKMNNFVSA